MYTLLAQLETQTQLTVEEPVMSEAVVGIIVAILFVVITVSMWKIFTKAGKSGWAAIVPIYNLMVDAEVGGKPGWWGPASLVLLIVPFLGSPGSPLLGSTGFLLLGWIVFLLIWAMISLGIAKNFGKGPAFGVLLLLLPLIGYPILAFGSAQYQPQAGGSSDGQLPPPPSPQSSQPPQPPQTPQTPPQAPTSQSPQPPASPTAQPPAEPPTPQPPQPPQTPPQPPAA